MQLAIDLQEVHLKSVNRKYYKNFNLTAEYRAFKQLLSYSVKRLRNPLNGPYSVHIFKKTYLDIDNTVKPILDVLQGKVFKNDNNVLSLKIYKLKRKRGHKSALRVYVEDIGIDDMEKKFKEIDFL